MEPLGGTHHVSIREHRTAVDWAEEIKYLVDVMYPDAEKFNTPKHGSWLDLTEIELNVMTRQCLFHRIADIELLRRELSSWETERNTIAAKVDWHFRTGDARIKLKSLYPSLGLCLLFAAQASKFQHILNKNPIPPAGILHQHMGDGADQVMILDNGCAAQGHVNTGVKDFSRFLEKMISVCRKQYIFDHF